MIPRFSFTASPILTWADNSPYFRVRIPRRDAPDPAAQEPPAPREDSPKGCPGPGRPGAAGTAGGAPKAKFSHKFFRGGDDAGHLSVDEGIAAGRADIVNPSGQGEDLTAVFAGIPRGHK